MDSSHSASARARESSSEVLLAEAADNSEPQTVVDPVVGTGLPLLLLPAASSSSQVPFSHIRLCCRLRGAVSVRQEQADSRLGDCGTPFAKIAAAAAASSQASWSSSKHSVCSRTSSGGGEALATRSS